MTAATCHMTLFCCRELVLENDWHSLCCRVQNLCTLCTNPVGLAQDMSQALHYLVPIIMFSIRGNPQAKWDGVPKYCTMSLNTTNCKTRWGCVLTHIWCGTFSHHHFWTVANLAGRGEKHQLYWKLQPKWFRITICCQNNVSHTSASLAASCHLNLARYLMEQFT